MNAETMQKIDRLLEIHGEIQTLREEAEALLDKEVKTDSDVLNGLRRLGLREAV